MPAKPKARRVKSLQQFLKAYGRGEAGVKAREQFAHRCDTTLAYLVHVAWGFRKASTMLALKIENASHGLVTLEDLRPDLDWSVITTNTARAPRAAAATT